MEFGIEYEDGKIFSVFPVSGEEPEDAARGELAWAQDQYEQGNEEFAGARIVVLDKTGAWALWTEE